MAARIRALDWAPTALGPIERWPLPLKAAVGMMLASPQAMWIAWGPELIQLYNDRYVSLLDGARHPSILGKPATKPWADSWHPATADLESILAGGPSVSYADRRLARRRNGHLRDRYFTYSYSAIPDPSAPSGVGGVLCLSFETTSAVAFRATEERQAFLLRLSDTLRSLTDSQEIEHTACRLLAEHLSTEVDGHRVFEEDLEPVTVRFVEHGGARPSTGRPFVATDLDAWDGVPETVRSAYQAHGIRAIASIPLVRDGQLMATLGVLSSVVPEWTPQDVGLFQQVAERVWSAIERARGEEALRESEARFRTIWEAISEALAISDPQGTVLAANPAYLALYGFDESEVVGHSFAVIFPEEQRAWAEEQYGIVFASEDAPPSFQSQVRRHDGSERVVESRASFITEHGRRTALVSAIRDVTDRVATEAALRASEERLATVLDTLPVGVGVVDRNGAMLMSNREMYRFMPTGVMPTWDTERASRWRAWHPGGRLLESSEYPAARALRGERVVPGIEMRYLKDDGREMWTRVAAVPLRGEGDTIDGLVAVVTDIDASRRTEEEMRASEERFRAVANLVPDLLWQSAPDGSSDWFNDRWYVYTGQGEAEAAGWGWLNAIHPEDRTRTEADFARARVQGRSLRLEIRIRAAGGTYRWFLAHAEPLRDASGMIVRWFGAATDVHEAREARDELEQRVAGATAELRSLSRRLLVIQEEERRHLARELHDEIGQMLTGLSLNLRPGMANPDARLEEAQRIVHDLTNQVRQLSMDLRPSALDTHGLLPALVWHIERYQNRTGIHIDLRHEGVDRRFPPAVEIAAYRIVQEALTNIARHAGVGEVTVQLLATDGTLVASVRDRGRGFHLGNGTDSSGLSGMRERVRLVGGTLSIDTAPGEGTVVMAELPVDDSGIPCAPGAES